MKWAQLYGAWDGDSLNNSNSMVLAARIFVLVLIFVFAGTAPCFAASCEGLANLKLAETTITSAEVVGAGKLTLNGDVDAEGAAALRSLPEFCRVTAEVKPAKDSDIKLEVWMPVSGWNGKFGGLGNGGFAGTVNYEGLIGALKLGFAVASTDTGHQGSPIDSSWAPGHPEKVVDFGYRAIHEMTTQAKAIVQAFYGDAPKRSYFTGCSNGGRQALMEAQRYPEDYDGVVAGAPANNWTHLLAAGIWDLQAMQGNPAAYIPTSKVPALSAAVLAACDAKDGVSDGIVNDPRECHFDPATMLCKGEDSNSCLTAPQVAGLKKLYEGMRSSKGEKLFPERVAGGEDGGGGWPAWVTGRGPGKSLQYAFSVGFFANIVFENKDWDFRTFNFDSDVKLVDEKEGAILNANNPDLKRFEERGGKLILFHGWSDAAIQPLSTIDYYNAVAHKMGKSETERFVRLFMAPGMHHCSGGPGPNSFGQEENAPTDPQHNLYRALERWVEKGVAPDKIIATKYKNDDRPAEGVKMTRPLCAYPQVANYLGHGDTNDQANFVCGAEKK
ncbi:MAG TPA: tannase/feruloyl esterase family alpha/beta hydrolase [Candidatus Acidoferrum sp.]|jgi:feruloyl esterase